MNKPDVVDIAQKRRHLDLLQRLSNGEALSAGQIRELKKYEQMKNRRDANKDKKVTDPLRAGRKQRHLELLNRIQGGKGLSPAQQTELKNYEMAATRQKMVEKQVFKTAIKAAKYAKVSTRTLQTWRKMGLERLDGGGYSKLLIDEFIKWKKQKQRDDKKQYQPGGYAGEAVTETEKQRRLMADKRRAERDISIPPVKNPRRRKRGEDPVYFCRTYYPDLFYNPFTKEQLEIIGRIEHCLKYGGMDAIAATRGGGKTTIAKVVGGVWAPIYGITDFVPLLGPNGPHAEELLKDVKDFYEFNDMLAEDFPEVCIPIRALEGAAQKGGSQTVGGKRTRIEWATKEIVLPYVEVGGKPSQASGAIIKARGIDAAIRGMVRGARRPRFALCDDLETTVSARSLTEISHRKEVIEKDVLGFAGPGKRMAAVILCTIIRAGCLSDQLTDPKLYPAWGGTRYRFLIKEPDRTDMWAKYMQKRQRDFLDGDKFGRSAHKYYLKNRKKMDKGAEISNPYNFIDEPIKGYKPKNKKQTKVPDLWREEVSAMQRVYNTISDKGQDHFDTEFQNDPKIETVEGLGIEVTHIQKKLSKVPRGKIPAGCIKVVGAIDVHRQYLRWLFMGVRPGMVGYVLDYGAWQIHAPAGNADKDTAVKKGLEEAILMALLELRDEVAATGFVFNGTNIVKQPDMVLVDSAYMPTPVHQFAVATRNRYRSAKGLGASSMAGRFSKPAKCEYGGANWYYEQTPKGKHKYPYLGIDDDYYKSRVHDGFMVEGVQRGSIFLYGEDPIVHRGYAEEVTAEVYREEFIVGKGLKQYWHVKSRQNHCLDTTKLCVAAGEMLGVAAVGGVGPGKKQTTRSAASSWPGYLDGVKIEI